MAIHWQIKFKSFFQGTDYTLNIYDADYLGSPVQLKGGASPFSTQEDESEDIFLPVRKQTGSIRIVDDGKDAAGNILGSADSISALLPANDYDRIVQLVHTENGSTVIDWQGYIQSENFGATLYENPQERELSVMCALSILDTTDINYQNTRIQNFAYLLNQCVTYIYGLTFQYIYLMGSYDGASEDVRDLLLKKLDWQNFVDEDAEGNLTAKYQLGQCLEDMCAFFGLTARTCGNCLYLIMEDRLAVSASVYNGKAWRLTPGELSQMAVSGTLAGTQVSVAYPDFSGRHIFASTDNDDFMVRGIFKATVTADINGSDGKLIDMKDETVCDTLKSAGWGEKKKYAKGATRYTNDVTAISTPYLSGTARGSGYGAFYIGRIYSEENYQDYPMIGMKQVSNGTPQASLQTVYEHGMSKNRIQLSGTGYVAMWQLLPESDNTIFEYYFIIRIGIGRTRSSALWLNYTDNGSSWVATPTNLRVGLKHKGNTLTIVSSGGASYTDIIDVADGLSGLIFIDFLGPSTPFEVEVEQPTGKETVTATAFDLADFSIKVIHGFTFTNDPDDGTDQGGEQDRLEYEAKNDARIIEERAVDLPYGSNSQKEKFGYGILMNADGSWADGLHSWTTGGTVAFEQLLADRMIAFGNHARRKLACDFMTNGRVGVGAQATTAGATTPLTCIRNDNKWMCPIAVSREWRDDIIRISMIEID